MNGILTSISLSYVNAITLSLSQWAITDVHSNTRALDDPQKKDLDPDPDPNL